MPQGYFELFDFALGDSGVYLDVKHWKADLTGTDGQEQVEKALCKLSEIEGAKGVVYLNLIIEEGCCPQRYGSDGEAVTIPGIIEEASPGKGRVIENMLIRLEREVARLAERQAVAVGNGNNPHEQA